MADKPLGLPWLTSRVTLLAQQLDKTLAAIEQLAANQKAIGEELARHRERLEALEEK